MVLFLVGARDFMFSEVSRMARGPHRLYLVCMGLRTFMPAVNGQFMMLPTVEPKLSVSGAVPPLSAHLAGVSGYSFTFTFLNSMCD